MTKLSTHIPIEYVKQSKKLQKLEYQKIKDKKWLEETNFKVFLEETEISIADIIDNAEMLFGKHLIKIKYANWEEVAFVNYSFAILDKCFDNKSIDEISKYIIKNIKYE